MEIYKQRKVLEEKQVTNTSNIFRAAIVDIKMGAAGKHLETLISFLACCSANVGTIGPGRNNFNDILSCLEITVNTRMKKWLMQPLTSTLLPPHFWATVDKATPSRTTNQAVLIVARDNKGTPCPIPVAAPVIYNEFQAATYEKLADILLQAIEDNFAKDVTTRLCGVAADGPYHQASGFREKLIERTLGVEAEDCVDMSLPVTWDAAHLINLGVLDVKDSQTPSGIHFQRFIKRCNVFNTLLAHGKGFAFLQLVDKDVLRPVSYATQRFTSSSYEQWTKIERSYNAFCKAFDLLNPNRDEDEETQYKILGSDFVSDLLAFLDTLEPIVNLMLRVQSLDCPVWKLKLWWPKVKSEIEKGSRGDQAFYKRLAKVKSSIKPGGQFQGVDLLEGWLITKTDSDHNTPGNSAKRYTWKVREEEDIERDHNQFALDLMNAVDSRINSVISKPFLAQLEIFDAGSLVSLQCGHRQENGNVKLSVCEGEYESYGVEESKVVMKSISNLPHIISSGMDFDERLAHRNMLRIKEAVFAGVWNRFCPHWFIDKCNNPLKKRDADLVEFTLSNPDSLFDVMYTLRYNDGEEHTVRLHEQSVYASFYSQEEVYSIAKAPSCVMVDVVLAKGGPEAIAESYYSAMRAQQQSGGQANDTLARRTKLNWCIPSLRKCESIIKESVQLYLKGDGKIKAHRITTFFSSRANTYNVSKVVDRVDSNTGRCPFLADV